LILSSSPMCFKSFPMDFMTENGSTFFARLPKSA
jgi:hypothetical protein